MSTLMAQPALGQSRIAVLEEPQGLAVGVAVAIGGVNAWELQAEMGVTYLAARAIVEESYPLLSPLGAALTAECDRSGIRFTLAVPIDSWELATERLLSAIFDRPPSLIAIERARAAILRELALTEGALTAEIRGTLASSEYGAGDRWARSPCGTTTSIAALRGSDTRRIAGTRFSPHRTTAAVAGPVREGVARDLLSRFIQDTDLPILVPAPSNSPTLRNQRRERDTVNAWLGLAFPFAKGTDLEAIRLLAFMIVQEVGPHPARPEIYDTSVEIVQHGAGGAIMVYLVTAPPQAEVWLERVRALIRRVGEVELSEPTFNALLRRYTGDRLLTLESPEARARDAALQLFYEASYTPPSERIRALDAVSLMQVAGRLGSPAVAYLGPD